MRKLIIILMLIGNSLFAQTSLPSSGPLSVQQIASFMHNLTEISTEQYLSGNYTIAFLNAMSHLSDKTPPYSISDWYGYTGTPTVNSFTVTTVYFSSLGDVPSASTACTSSKGTPPVLYYAGTLGVGTTLYRDSGLTAPAFDGSYKYGTNYFYIHASPSIGGSGPEGQVKNYGSCP